MRPDEQSDLGDFAWGCAVMVVLSALMLLAVVLYAMIHPS